MSDIGEGFHAVGSIIDLTKDILNRADRDGPIKELNEDQIKIQNGFADNNLDAQWACAYRLLNSVGHSFASGGVVGETDRQFRYHALICIAELKYARAIIARMIDQQSK